MFTDKKINFAGLEEGEYKGEVKFTILPISYERTATYGKGTGKGAEEILKASPNLEFFDEELGFTPLDKMKVKTLPGYDAEKYSPEEMIEKVSLAFTENYEKDSIIASIGGEHSITAGISLALKRLGMENITFVQLDAHGDLREEYEGSKYNHACVMKRVRENWDTCHIGIRAIDEEEYMLIKKENIKVFFAKDIVGNREWINKALSSMKDKVYLTLDIDAFDSSFMPATGTPEPGGFQWYEMLYFLKRLIEEKEIISFDIVEFAPIEKMHAYNFTAAKLLYKIMSYIAHKKTL